MVIPPVLVAISFWIHFIGITLWVGGSLLMPLAISPAIGLLDPPSRGKAMAAISAKLTPLFFTSIVLVFLSGIVQTIAYGMSLTLTIKIIVALVMVGNGLYLGVVLTKKVGTLAPAPGTPPSAEFLKAQRLLVMHGWIQVGLAVLVLLITGFLRAGSPIG